MGHVPPIPLSHEPREEFTFGFYRLNLTSEQLDAIAKKLDLPAQHKNRLKQEQQGYLPPSDGQQIMITYKGKYVRIWYKDGKVDKITPEGTWPLPPSSRRPPRRR